MNWLQDRNGESLTFLQGSSVVGKVGRRREKFGELGQCPLRVGRNARRRPCETRQRTVAQSAHHRHQRIKIPQLLQFLHTFLYCYFLNNRKFSLDLEIPSIL